MRGIFEITYVLLWGLVALEASLLQEVLKRTLRLKRLYLRVNQQLELPGPPPGTTALDFSGLLLGTGEVLRARQLKGSACLLFFVSLSEQPAPSYQGVTTAIRAMWHRVRGRIYLVCVGSVGSCRKLAPYLRVNGFAEDELPIVVDEDGSIAHSFKLDNTPAAVELDEDLRVARFGHPILPTEAQGEVEDNDTRYP